MGRETGGGWVAFKLVGCFGDFLLFVIQKYSEGYSFDILLTLLFSEFVGAS